LSGDFEWLSWDLNIVTRGALLKRELRTSKVTTVSKVGYGGRDIYVEELVNGLRN
jgi:hypothetical protein